MKLIFSKKIVLFLLLGALLLAPIGVDRSFAQTGCDANLDGKTDAELEALLARCEAEINAQREALRKTQAEASNLESGIKNLSSKIKQSELEIQKRSLQIRQLQNTIGAKSAHIGELSEQIVSMHDSLSELVRKTNEYGSRSPLEAVLSQEDFSTFFADVDAFEVVKRELGVRLEEIKELKARTEKEKQELAEKKSQEELQRIAREKEKRQTENLKGEQQRVLTVTKGQEALYKKDIADKEKIKAQIRGRLLRTVGGLEITFGAALDLIEPYEDSVGIPAALVLAILTQESGINGVIGKNIGRCTYAQSWPNSAGTVMSNTQKPYFLAIANELGINAETTPVSCPISQDGEYGGAMGPSQFMPQTWAGFKAGIARVTGSNPPSPFNNRDAFVGTMLYLAEARPRCQAAFSTTQQVYACIAAKYYSGLNSSGTRLARYMAPGSYGGQVASRAIQFQSDIDKLRI